MSKVLKGFIFVAIVTAALVVTSSAQVIKTASFDVTNYVIDATVAPSERRISATVDVAFTPLEETRAVAFELNGSLKVESVTRQDKTISLTPTATPTAKKTPKPTPTPVAAVTFVQDQSNSSELGPHVRVDLGTEVAAGTPVVLRFKYSGILDTPQGGPLLSKRLAWIGDSLGYLMYAARWFPFHAYASDTATSDITISLPPGYQVVGNGERMQSTGGESARFAQATPALTGNIFYSRNAGKTLRYGDQELQFFAKPGNDERIGAYGETLGKTLANYTRRFGQPASGKRLVIAQIDDESLEYYSAPGMIFVGNRQFEEGREATLDRLQREAAYQWWGLTVGLKTFDDAWLSQGLAEYSAYSLREGETDPAKLDALRRDLLERALTFEQTVSILRAPATLDDQSTGYQYIMFAKGAFVFKLLRDTLGQQKFDQLLRTFLQEFRGKNASIDDFEKLTSRIAGQPMRYFFARWVESTGVPEFSSDYQILRTRGGKFIARGTVKQNYDNLRLPVDVELRSEGGLGSKVETLQMDEASADFNIEATGKPLAVIIDPGYKLLRISPDLRISSIARRGIEQFKEGNYPEAQQQFEEALKLDRSNSWIYYHLGLLFLDQRNYDLAIDNFKAAQGGNLDPAWLAVWSNIKMGNAYDAKGDRTRAVAAYKRAEATADNYDNAQDAAKRYMATPYDPKEKAITAVK